MSLSMVLMMFMFTACDEKSKDDKDDTATELVGSKWQLVKEEYKYVYGEEVEEGTYEYEPTEMVWEFKADGELVLSSYGDDAYDDGDKVSYKLEGSKLTLSMYGGEVTEIYTIKELDSKEMILSVSESYMEDGMTFSADVQLYFEKI